jgi:hypothetical protein
VPTQDATNIYVNYVGVLKDILKFDYAPMQSPNIIFQCEWMKRKDNRGNLTYVRGDDGFFTLSF